MKKLAALAVTLALVIMVALLAIWHYKSARDKAETKLTRQGERVAILEAQLERAVKGGTRWSKVLHRGAADSIVVASGDSLTFERLDSLPLRVTVPSKTAVFTLDVSPKPNLTHNSNWIKIEIDSSATSDSVRMVYHTWRANWTR